MPSEVSLTFQLKHLNIATSKEKNQIHPKNESSNYNFYLTKTVAEHSITGFFIKDAIKSVSMGMASPLRTLGRIDPEVLNRCIISSKKEGIIAFKPILTNCVGKIGPSAKMVGIEQFLNHTFTYMSGSSITGAISSAFVGASLDIFTRYTVTDIKAFPKKYILYTTAGLTCRNSISIQNIQLDDPVLSAIGNGISRIVDSATLSFVNPEGIKITPTTIKSFRRHLPANALFTMAYTFLGQNINKLISEQLIKN